MKTDLSFFYLMFYIFLDVIRWHILVLIQKRLRLNVVLIFLAYSCRQLLINFFNEVRYPVGWTDINRVKNKRKNYTKKTFSKVDKLILHKFLSPRTRSLGSTHLNNVFRNKLLKKQQVTLIYISCHHTIYLHKWIEA